MSKVKNKQAKQKKILKKSKVKTGDNVEEMAENDPLPKPETANTLDSKVEEIFQVTNVRFYGYL